MDDSIERTDIEAARAALGDLVIETPVHHWQGPELAAAVGRETEVILKLELFQRTGTFKPAWCADQRAEPDARCVDARRDRGQCW